MNLIEYTEHDAIGLAERVRSGDTTPGELAALALAAIKAVNPELNAVIEVYRDRVPPIHAKTFG